MAAWGGQGKIWQAWQLLGMPLQTCCLPFRSQQSCRCDQSEKICGSGTYDRQQYPVYRCIHCDCRRNPEIEERNSTLIPFSNQRVEYCWAVSALLGCRADSVQRIFCL